MENIQTLKERLNALLSKKRKIPYTISELMSELKCKKRALNSTIKELKEDGKSIIIFGDKVEYSTEIQKNKPNIVVNKNYNKVVKIGFTTDNHLGSKYERLDVLKSLYNKFEKEGITDVYNAGNMIDGVARFNKYDLHKHGYEDQVNYLVKVFPKHDKITTHFITGDDHEGWATRDFGLDVGRLIENRAKEQGRNDLHYLGHMEHDIILKAPKGKAILRIVHPGGGSAYAISYTTQKLIESYTSGEKPNILLIGHYHKAEYLYYRGVYAIQGGTTMDQSPFMRKKRIAAHVGGWILEYTQAENGTIISLKAEWIPFYDREYYKEKNWKYQW